MPRQRFLNLCRAKDVGRSGEKKDPFLTIGDIGSHLYGANQIWGHLEFVQNKRFWQRCKQPMRVAFCRRCQSGVIKGVVSHPLLFGDLPGKSAFSSLPGTGEVYDTKIIQQVDEPCFDMPFKKHVFTSPMGFDYTV